jgi:hypothetical protein
MTAGLIVLLTSVIMIFFLGVFIGHRFTERRLAAQAKRQAAAHSSIYRQLRELRAERQRTDAAPDWVNVSSFSGQR